MYTIRPDTKFKFDNTIIKDKPVKGVGLSEDGNFLMIRQKVGGFLGFGRTTVRTVVDVSEMESNAKKDLMKRIATQISGTHFWNSKNKHKNIINDNGLNENSVITIKYKSKDRGTKLGQARIALKIIHGNKNNDNTFFHGLRNSAEFQDNPYVSGEVKKQIQGKMKEGDKLLKRLN
ncbi:MAG: hypothetical protein LBI77_00300, partial [Puniceicoccales bacterium]|nr:hypothetical protein [Puniceicoccales bacterium]